MTSKDDNRFCFPAWGMSLVLHGAVVGLALVFVAQLKPVLQEKTFQWDVALTAEARPETESNQAESVAASVHQPVKKLPPSQTKSGSEISQPTMPTEQKIEPLQPTIEQAPPIEQQIEVPQLRDEPAIEAKDLEDVAAAPIFREVEAQPVPHDPISDTSDLVLSSEVSASQESPVPVLASGGSMDTIPLQTANIQESGPEAKLDNRWLAESLWRRVAGLKRYPNSARMNGQEGKVILKAVIRSDGQLADVFVQKSSGYSALDEAAMEAVRLACPLHMRHAIGKSQIVVSLPIVYSLAN